MASEQDLAEQLLRRADEDAAGAKGMLPIDEVADVLVCFHCLCRVGPRRATALSSRRVSSARPPNPVCVSPHTGLSTSPSRWVAFDHGALYQGEGIVAPR
jgi:hypothetical protein